MNIKSILVELDEVIEKLKFKIMFYQTENRELRIKINELKDYVKNIDKKIND